MRRSSPTHISIPIFRVLESLGLREDRTFPEKRLPTCLTLAKESSKLVGVGDDPATRMPRGKVIRVFFEPVQDHAGANVLFTETLAVRKPIAENIGDGGQKPRWRECRPIKNKLATSVVKTSAI